MITVKKSDTRGLTKTDWLTSYHSFSFNQYFDPESMNFGMLRVLNDDLVAPGAGFGSHTHHNMEIVTYVVKGALEHKDNTGGHGIIREGDVQRMSAGSGIAHSEFNASQSETSHFLQIWIFPDQRGLLPSYGQKSLPRNGDKFSVKVASGKHSEALLRIHQDVDIEIVKTVEGQAFERALSQERGYYLFLIEGQLTAGNQIVQSGDALLITGEKKVSVTSGQSSHFVWFDVVMDG